MNGIIVMIHCCFTYYSNLVVLAFSKIYQSSNSYFFLEFFFFWGYYSCHNLFLENMII